MIIMIAPSSQWTRRLTPESGFKFKLRAFNVPAGVWRQPLAAGTHAAAAAAHEAPRHCPVHAHSVAGYCHRLAP